MVGINVMVKNMNEKIIQKYSRLLSQKIYDCFCLEHQLEIMGKNGDYLLKEIERLKKLLDDNGIDYKTDDEVSLSPVENVTENINEQDSNVNEND